MADCSLAALDEALPRWFYIPRATLSGPGDPLRIGRSPWTLLAYFDAALVTVLAVVGVAGFWLGFSSPLLYDAVGSILAAVAAAGFLIALLIGGVGITETAADGGVYPVSVPGMPVIIVTPDHPQAVDRRRETIAARRGRAMALGLTGFAFLGFAVLLLVGLWAAYAAMLATAAVVGAVLVVTRPS